MSEESSSMAKLARVSFCIYLFFVFFGTSLPFQPSMQERAATGDIGGSNMINQLLSLLFVASFLSLIGKQQQVFDFIRKEKFLTLFLLWSLLSITWSNYPVVSLKRWITLFGEAVICLAVMVNVKWSEVALRYFRVILSIYLPLTILSVIFVPAAIQWEFPAWRGLAITKNNLGQVALFSVIVCLAIIPYNKGRAVNYWHYMLLAIAFVSLIGAQSTTNMIVGAFLVMIVVSVYVANMANLGAMSGFFSFTMIAGFIAVVAIVTIWAPAITASILGLAGKDLTFTGRVDLWATVIRMTESKIFTGWGLGGFWIMDSRHLIPVFEEFVWIPNQSHQGYIDILNQTGIVGLGLLVMMALSYIKNTSKLNKKNVWKWLFFGVLVLNFQESVFFRPRHIGHFVFLFAYVAFFTDLLKEQKAKKESIFGNRYVISTS
ncbi:MAG: O-antigen ligase family protein [Bacteroidota bacterium]